MLSDSLLEESARKADVFPLRPAQTRALRAFSAGQNLLIVWPTGSGKSLCYQLPALQLPGLTLVISPLIALMDDQVIKARARGWPMTCVHSGVKRGEREKRLRAVEEGRIKLLYVTPERFRQTEFVDLLARRTVSLLAVDEAHCISQWGHDFRPDYSKIGEVRRRLGDPPTMALTATATLEVQRDILAQLRLEPKVEVLSEGFARPNLFLGATEFDHADDKLEPLIEWLRRVDGAKIVYFTLIGTLSKTADFLSARGFELDVYHGDLDDRRRRQSLRRFISGEGGQLMLATPAFGLGVDKPDIRGILHFELPGSLEAYFQEVGRAGRDGSPSTCELLYAQSDLETQMRFIDTLTPEPAYVAAVYRLLGAWRDRLNVISLDDLRAQLSFKNARDFRLETALSFLDRWGVIHYPQRRLDRLEFLRPLNDDDLDSELWTKRRLSLQKKLLSLVQWFRSVECRKVGIYRYFGASDAEPCGNCDRCREAGR